jgi:lipopolysaccharide export LptBFGC system permease protein LptF
VSLYRIAVPMFVCAAGAATVVFLLDQNIVGPYLERAERLRLIMNGQAAAPLNPLSFGWVQGSAGDIYHFRLYDPTMQRLVGLSRYEFTPDMTRVTKHTYAEEATFAGASGSRGPWEVTQGWTREFDEHNEVTALTPLVAETRDFEPSTYYGIEQPDPKFMRLGELRRYTDRMVGAGYDMFSQQVWLARRLAFPFGALVMTLIAVPFAVTIGRGGAMAGIAVGIGLALLYWVSVSVFAALGGGGLLTPTLAAWAPNLLFGAGALYLLLTVKT